MELTASHEFSAHEHSPGKDLADRYRFISLFPPRGEASTAWRAMDLAFDEEVVVYFLTRDLPPTAEEAAAFGAAFERASLIPRSGTIRWHTLDLESRLAVREWVNGFTLHELLRRRRKISVAQTLSLLGGLPETLDAMCAAGIAPSGDLLRETWLAFEPGCSALPLLAREPSEWPEHHTKVTVMRLGDFWREEGGDTIQVTTQPLIDTSPISIRLARIICELLGGRIRNEGWMPLPALNEEANELLRDTTDGKKWNSACDFWKAFEPNASKSKSGIQAIHPARKPFSFSIASGSGPTPCRVAALIPQDAAQLPIHLCAGRNSVSGAPPASRTFPPSSCQRLRRTTN